MLNTSLFEANEHSTVLPSMKQITPSSRSNETEGVGDRSEVGRIPSKGQKKIFGNLDRQSTGQVGKLDTQGKESPTTLFRSVVLVQLVLKFLTSIRRCYMNLLVESVLLVLVLVSSILLLLIGLVVQLIL